MLYLRKKKMVELCTRDINKCKITNWKKRSKTADWENPLRMGRSALDCSAIWEGGEGGGGGEEEEVEAYIKREHQFKFVAWKGVKNTESQIGRKMAENICKGKTDWRECLDLREKK